MSDGDQNISEERKRPPGEPRSWEKREEPSVASEKRWAGVAKTFVYTVWITLLAIAIAFVVLYARKNGMGR